MWLHICSLLLLWEVINMKTKVFVYKNFLGISSSIDSEGVMNDPTCPTSIGFVMDASKVLFSKEAIQEWKKLQNEPFHNPKIKRAIHISPHKTPPPKYHIPLPIKYITHNTNLIICPSSQHTILPPTQSYSLPTTTSTIPSSTQLQIQITTTLSYSKTISTYN